MLTFSQYNNMFILYNHNIIQFISYKIENVGLATIANFTAPGARVSHNFALNATLAFD